MAYVGGIGQLGSPRGPLDLLEDASFIRLTVGPVNSKAVIIAACIQQLRQGTGASARTGGEPLGRQGTTHAVTRLPQSTRPSTSLRRVVKPTATRMGWTRGSNL